MKVIEADLWRRITTAATHAGLNPEIFCEPHHDIVREVARHLSQPEPAPNVPPIIICGEPGTGKTTFLYVLDEVLRTHFALPDAIETTMRKDGRAYDVHKRPFHGREVSLLSVRKWRDLLHFYAWDIEKHRFDTPALDQFIRGTLAPMRVVLADEVEMTGYAPTIPDLAARGLLVIGTSNQYQFQQLDHEQISPLIIQFEGADMRAGDPADAVATPNHAGWPYFDQTAAQKECWLENLPYQLHTSGRFTFTYLNFSEAVKAPLLENEWLTFLKDAYKEASPYIPLQQSTPYLLLLDHFSLDVLQTDYNAIIRYVYLLDAIEQLGIGLLVRDPQQTPLLSRTMINAMKETVQNANGVSLEIKAKTLAGVDRSTSRLGQAGFRAQNHLEKK